MQTRTRQAPIVIPERVASAARRSGDLAWLAQLPSTVGELQRRWSLSLSSPFDHEDVSCAWVAPAVRSDGTPVVVKVGMPHMEAAHEIEGLRFWSGDPTIELLDADVDANAMLLERCEPGTLLRRRPEPEQTAVIAGLLRRLWRRPAAPHPFRPLAAMLRAWTRETTAAAATWPDAALVEEGLRLFEQLSRPSPDDVLLATDLHAGNVLGARREPWLAIDPKPFIGDRAYDATQHLFNCHERLGRDPIGTVRQFADLLEIDADRLRLWMFARAAAEPRDRWDEDSMTLAKALA
jgi:streptomycin 6-kinase